MKKIYSYKRITFFSSNSNYIEVRTTHSLLFGFFNWTTTKKFTNKL